MDNGQWKEVERLEPNPSQDLISAEQQNVDVPSNGIVHMDAQLSEDQVKENGVTDTDSSKV